MTKRAVSFGVVLGLLTVAQLALAESLPDPTRPAGAVRAERHSLAARPAPVLSAIIVRRSRRIAVIDGRPMQAGDRVGDLQIEEILDDAVRYTRAGTRGLSRLPRLTLPVRKVAPARVPSGDKQ